MVCLESRTYWIIAFGVLLPWIVTRARGLSDRFNVANLSWVNLHKATALFVNDQCAGSTIIHRGFGKCQGNLGVFVIPHKLIFHDGVQCGTQNPDEYTILVPSERITNAQTAAFNNLLTLYAILAANERAINAFRVLDGIDPIYVGFELTSDRVCGSNIIPQNSIYLFIIPGRNDINFGFAYLGRAEMGMVLVRPDEQLCMYKQSRRLGPGQPAFETPTPSPSASEYNLDHSFFVFDNVEGIPTCFPAHGIDVARPSPSGTPSVSPSASHSSSIGPSMSVTATPTISIDVQTMSAAATVSSSASEFGGIPSSVATASLWASGQSQSIMSSSSPTWMSSGTPILGRSNIISPSNFASMSVSASTSVSATAVTSGSQAVSVTGTLSASESGTTSISVTPSGMEQTSAPSTSPPNNTSEPGALCFPTKATVQLSTGEVVTMGDLKVGDLVRVRKGMFSPVIMFTHREFDIWENFVMIRTLSKNKTLILSSSHYLYSGGVLKTAQEVQTGDNVTLEDGDEDEIDFKKWVIDRGLHNPHTLDGTIVVNGILTSTFTRAVAPVCATGLMTPVRGLYRLGGSSRIFGGILRTMQKLVMRVGQVLFEEQNKSVSKMGIWTRKKLRGRVEIDV